MHLAKIAIVTPKMTQLCIHLKLENVFSNTRFKLIKRIFDYFHIDLYKIMFNGFKMSSFRCKSYVQKLISPKNMFGYQLKLISRVFGIFYVSSYKPNYSYTIMYECENSPPSHELF
jgi:hypothetical protein